MEKLYLHDLNVSKSFSILTRQCDFKNTFQVTNLLFYCIFSNTFATYRMPCIRNASSSVQYYEKGHYKKPGMKPVHRNSSALLSVMWRFSEDCCENHIVEDMPGK